MRPIPRRHFLGVPIAAAASAAMTSSGRQHAEIATGGGPRRLRHPAFLDLQVNGFAGVDFNDPSTSPEQVHQALAALRRHGVTQVLPTIISGPLERNERCARTLLQASAPAILGLHMEGPYISPEDGARGAHRREDTAPASIDDFKRRQDIAGGRVRIVTVAPEVAGALALIEHLRDTGVRAAIGHTAATPEQVREAVRAGATLSTHLGNGCAQMLPRHPNFLWEQLAADELLASIIVDGHHLPGATVKSMVRAKTPRRVVLVTDAIAAAGQPPGDYQLGALSVRLDENGRVAVPGQPNLAGSALSMDHAVANTVKFAGVTLEDALAMASTLPSEYLGVKTSGSLDLEWDAATYTLRVTRVDG
jgi:N-acetylglucosamine-6-phosphate deacetylase